MGAVMRSTASGCPEPETMAAYLDGRLGRDERAALTSHLAACEDCYFVLKESAQMHLAAATTGAAGSRDMSGSRAWLRAPKVWWSVAGSGLAAAAALTLVMGN